MTKVSIARGRLISEALVGWREDLIDVEELAILIAYQKISTTRRKANQRYIFEVGCLDFSEKHRIFQISNPN